MFYRVIGGGIGRCLNCQGTDWVTNFERDGRCSYCGAPTPRGSLPVSFPLNSVDLTEHVLNQAADLLTEPGDSNPEYDRALVELTCRTLGLSTDDNRETVEHLLRTRHLIAKGVPS